MLTIGPQQVADINMLPSNVGSSPSNLTIVGSTIYFTALNDEFGNEVWKSDGTSSGTMVLKDIHPSSSPTIPSTSSLTNVNGTLYFVADDGVNRQGLWKSDGTDAGTVLLKANRSGNLTNFNGTLYFSDDHPSGSSSQYLWKTDGTSNGTIPVLGPVMYGPLFSFNGALYFSGGNYGLGAELWKSDGTCAGTTLVKDINVGGDSGPQQFTIINGTMYFVASDATNGSALWKSDGTCAGTQLVKDIAASSLQLDIRYLTNVNGTLYFQANDGVRGKELWKSDGTNAGTVLVKDISAGGGDADPRYLTNVGGALFFRANDGISGNELWRSDGTIAGTTLVNDINSGSANSDPHSFANMNGVLYFSAKTTAHGIELWKSDGSSGGTTLVKDIRPITSYSNPRFLTNLNGTLYFRATGREGAELWKSDGTSSGTLLVKDVRPGTGSYPYGFTDVGGWLYFAAGNGTIGQELWKTNGTNRDTILVRDIYSGSLSSFPRYMTNVNGTLFFSADSSNGRELWKSDGTSSGTVLVKDIRAGTASSSPQHLINYNGTLLFAANDGTSVFANDSVSGVELWRSDGTSSGTVLVKNIALFSNGSYPRWPVVFDGAVFFHADDSLWKSDGTSSGTVIVKGGIASRNFPYSISAEPTIVGDQLYFRGSDFLHGVELWKTDGTSSGTVIVSDTSTNPSSTNPGFLTNVNGTLFFQRNNGQLTKTNGSGAAPVYVTPFFTPLIGVATPMCNVNGTLFVVGQIPDGEGDRLWKSEAPYTSTTLVRDLYAGYGNPNITELTNVNGMLYFQANDGIHGEELWRSDGTSSGTVLAADISAGGSRPTQLYNHLGTLYFTADNGTGYEPWRLADLPDVSLAAVTIPFDESGGTAVVTATLSIAFTEDVTLNLSFSGTAIGNLDYIASGSQIIIPAGQTSGSITLTGIDDLVSDSNESIIVDITSVANAVELGTQQVVATLVDLTPDPFGLIGKTLTIPSTSGDDTLTIQFNALPAFTIAINGLAAAFNTSTINSIQFDALAGNDTLLLFTNAAANNATLATTGVVVSGAGFTFSASNLEYKYLFGDALDSATFIDTAGNDQLYQLPSYSLMLDGGLTYYNQVIGFGSVVANATVGADLMLVYGTGGNDNYSASTTNSTLTSTNLSLVGNNFDQVFAFGSGGNDSATFTGGIGNELFYGLGGYGYSVVTSGAFLQYLIGFNQTTVNGGAGADSVIFFDAAGNDTFTGNPTGASMSGPGFVDTANGFEQVFAFATGGGIDTANLDGSNQDDIFSGNSANAALFRSGAYLLQVYNFQQVNALLTGTGNDLAELIDGAGNDFLNASGSTAEITYAAGNKIRLSAFDFVFAKNQNGGTNTKNVVDPLTFQLFFEGTWV